MAKKKTKKTTKTKKSKPQKEAEEKKEKQLAEPQLSTDAKKGILAIFLFTVALISILSLFGLASDLGTYLSMVLGYLFGWGQALFPIVLIIFGIALVFPDKYEINWTHYLGLVIFTLSFLGLLHLTIDLEQATSVFNDGRG